MSEKRLRYYDCDEILEFLDGTYFHPSRDKEFPSTQIKYAAQCALLRLWNKYGMIEELSVFYVGITRAKKQVFVSASRERINSQNQTYNTCFSCLANLDGIKLTQTK